MPAEQGHPPVISHRHGSAPVSRSSPASKDQPSKHDSIDSIGSTPPPPQDNRVDGNVRPRDNEQAMRLNSAIDIAIQRVDTLPRKPFEEDGFKTGLSPRAASRYDRIRGSRAPDHGILQPVETDDLARPHAILEPASTLVDRPSATGTYENAREHVLAFRGNEFASPSGTQAAANATIERHRHLYPSSEVDDGGYGHWESSMRLEMPGTAVLPSDDHSGRDDSESDSSDRPPSPNDGLEDQITGTFVETIRLPGEASGRFMPCGQLKRIVHEESVFKELKKVFNEQNPKKPRHSEKVLYKWARTVCGSEPRPKGCNTTGRQRAFRIIFSILVIIESTELITAFMEEGVSDNDLPLERRKGRGNRDVLQRMDPKSQKLRSVRCTKEWSWSAKNKFYEYQWIFLSPRFFFLNSPVRSVFHFRLKPDHVLPLEVTDQEANSGLSKVRGGYGDVYFVNLHPEHHEFHRPGFLDQGFAIKRLDSSEMMKSHGEEVRSLRRFSGAIEHTHVAPLLATFEQGSSFYFIFYRAEADLFGLWTQIEPQADCSHESILWMARQCTGLLDALSKFHNPIQQSNTFPDWRRSQSATHHSMSEKYFNIRLPSPIDGVEPAWEPSHAAVTERKRSQRRWSFQLPRESKIHPSWSKDDGAGNRGITGCVDDDADNRPGRRVIVSSPPPEDGPSLLGVVSSGDDNQKGRAESTDENRAGSHGGGRARSATTTTTTTSAAPAPPNGDFAPGRPIGRHFDIKPRNILYFRYRDRPDHRGVLTLADFGQAELGYKMTRSKTIGNFAFSSTYRAPECNLPGGDLRPTYDVWSLGCVFLEFIVWRLGGAAAIDAFADSREQAEEAGSGSGDATVDKTDTFFEMVPCEKMKLKAYVKKAVTKCITDAHEHERCSAFIGDFLDLIEDGMLVVDNNYRMGSRSVSTNMAQLLERCEEDPRYVSSPLDDVSRRARRERRERRAKERLKIEAEREKAREQREDVSAKNPRRRRDHDGVHASMGRSVSLKVDISSTTRFMPMTDPVFDKLRKWESAD